MTPTYTGVSAYLVKETRFELGLSDKLSRAEGYTYRKWPRIKNHWVRGMSSGPSP